MSTPEFDRPGQRDDGRGGEPGRGEQQHDPANQRGSGNPAGHPGQPSGTSWTGGDHPGDPSGGWSQPGWSQQGQPGWPQQGQPGGPQQGQPGGPQQGQSGARPVFTGATGVPGGGRSGFSVSSLGLGPSVLAGGTLVYLVAMFLPWITVSFGALAG